MIEYYDRQGRPLDMMDWALKLEDPTYRIVARDELCDGEVIVSTIWLGFDHGYGGKRLLFETMVRRDNKWDEQHRYSTEDEAREGHRQVVEALSRLLAH